MFFPLQSLEFVSCIERWEGGTCTLEWCSVSNTQRLVQPRPHWPSHCSDNTVYSLSKCIFHAGGLNLSRHGAVYNNKMSLFLSQGIIQIVQSRKILHYVKLLSFRLVNYLFLSSFCRDSWTIKITNITSELYSHWSTSFCLYPIRGIGGNNHRWRIPHVKLLLTFCPLQFRHCSLKLKRQ